MVQAWPGTPKAAKMLVEPPHAIDLLAHDVIGAAIEVHRHLGPGFVESVYEQAVAVELRLRGIPFQRQVPVVMAYKGHVVGRGRIDLLTDDQLIVEVKAVAALNAAHTAQVVSYLTALGQPLGLLINFHATLLRDGIRRVVRS